MPVKNITTADELTGEINNAGAGKLIVIDFTSATCGPCQMIAPVFNELSNKYPGVGFLKVDVKVNPDAAQAHGVTSTPTFVFFKDQAKVTSFSGANAEKLEGTISMHKGADPEGVQSYGKQFINIREYIDDSQMECLNQDDTKPLRNALGKAPGCLQSDCDEQLLISIPFKQPMRLHSIKISSTDKETGPKHVRLFANPIHMLQFEDAETAAATQEFDLTDKDLVPGIESGVRELQFVKFQNVHSLLLFIKDNQGGGDVTTMEELILLGQPAEATNMKEFKRVAGEVGETHG
eukprot:Clim_evm61s144 gene=Clim_evmTU61s144